MLVHGWVSCGVRVSGFHVDADGGKFGFMIRPCLMRDGGNSWVFHQDDSEIILRDVCAKNDDRSDKLTGELRIRIFCCFAMLRKGA